MAVFEAVDEVALKAAGLEHRTLTGVARMLVNKCSSDLDKARAIFRYTLESRGQALGIGVHFAGRSLDSGFFLRGERNVDNK